MPDTAAPPLIDPARWYTLGEASKALGGLYSVGQLRTRVRLGQIRHEVNQPLKEGGRVTYKVPGIEVLRLRGAAVVAGQMGERPESVERRIKRCLKRARQRQKAK